LIPGFDEVKNRSLAVGALGGGISGSGPSLFMMSESQATAIQVEKEMSEVYNQLGIEYKTYVTEVASKGVEVI
jgi:homoserine kinase